MRVRVWLDPNEPLIAGCMLRQDDGVMVQIEFKYEKVYKFCQRCGIIGHSTAHYPYLNPEIERLINGQIENIRQYFGFEIGYDLQSILFSNNLSDFHN